jgi:hypothetical protein
VLSAIALLACSGIDQVETDIEHTLISLGPTDLELSGIGFLTPTAATGREADNQSLALNFAKQLAQLRPEVNVVPLPQVLSAVNASNLNSEYKQMYQDYQETAVLDGAVLKKIGMASGVRYFAKLSLAGFRQETRGRFSLLGLRLFDTKQANLRIFMEIWDSHTGSVAWEGGQELNFAYESTREKPVTFHDVAKIAATQMYNTNVCPPTRCKCSTLSESPTKYSWFRCLPACYPRWQYVPPT